MTEAENEILAQLREIRETIGTDPAITTGMFRSTRTKLNERVKVKWAVMNAVALIAAFTGLLFVRDHDRNSQRSEDKMEQCRNSVLSRHELRTAFLVNYDIFIARVPGTVGLVNQAIDSLNEPGNYTEWDPALCPTLTPRSVQPRTADAERALEPLFVVIAP